MERGFHYTTRTDQYIKATAATTGIAHGGLGPCPQGFCWYIERMTCWTNSSVTATTAAPTLEIYVMQDGGGVPNDNSKQGRQDVAVGQIVFNAVSDERQPIYVGPGYKIEAVWTGLNTGDLVSLSLQVRVNKLEAVPVEQGTINQHAGMHEHPKHDPFNAPTDAIPVVVGDQVAEI